MAALAEGGYAEDAGLTDSFAPRLPAEIMDQVAQARMQLKQSQIISLDVREGHDELKVNKEVCARLKERVDEGKPYWAISLIGKTGAGKSHIAKHFLKMMGTDSGHLPFSLDFDELDCGGVPLSVTGDVSCFAYGHSLLFDFEGSGGTLPLLLRVLQGIGDRLKLTPKEARQQELRRACVSKYFPPLAFTVSNTVLYVSREPLNNDSTATDIRMFAQATAEATDTVRPFLIIAQNLCPLNQLRRGEKAQSEFTSEFLATHDSDSFLQQNFAGIVCMTFPDCNAYDKKKKLDGEDVFNEQLSVLERL